MRFSMLFPAIRLAVITCRAGPRDPSLRPQTCQHQKLPGIQRARWRQDSDARPPGASPHPSGSNGRMPQSLDSMPNAPLFRIVGSGGGRIALPWAPAAQGSRMTGCAIGAGESSGRAGSAAGAHDRARRASQSAMRIATFNAQQLTGDDSRQYPAGTGSGSRQAAKRGGGRMPLHGRGRGRRGEGCGGGGRYTCAGRPGRGRVSQESGNGCGRLRRARDRAAARQWGPTSAEKRKKCSRASCLRTAR